MLQKKLNCEKRMESTNMYLMAILKRLRMKTTLLFICFTLRNSKELFGNVSTESFFP